MGMARWNLTKKISSFYGVQARLFDDVLGSGKGHYLGEMPMKKMR